MKKNLKEYIIGKYNRGISPAQRLTPTAREYIETNLGRAKDKRVEYARLIGSPEAIEVTHLYQREGGVQAEEGILGGILNLAQRDPAKLKKALKLLGSKDAIAVLHADTFNNKERDAAGYLSYIAETKNEKEFHEECQEFLRKQKSGLETKARKGNLEFVFSIVLIIASIILLGIPKITGNIIASISLGASNIIAIMLFAIGFLGILSYVKRKTA